MDCYMLSFNSLIIGNEYVVPNLPDYVGDELTTNCVETEFGCCQNSSHKFTLTFQQKW